MYAAGAITSVRRHLPDLILLQLAEIGARVPAVELYSVLIILIYFIN